MSTQEFPSLPYDTGQFLDGLPEIAWLEGSDGNTLFLNRRWYDYTGFPAGDLTQIREAIHPDDLLASIGTFTEARLLGIPSETELRIRDQHGEFRWFRTRLSPLQKDGQISGWIGVSAEIDTQKRSEARYRAIFDHAAAGIAEMEPLTRRFLSVNRWLCDTLGYSESELTGCTDADLSHPDDVCLGTTQLGELARGDRASAHFVKRYRRKDGELRWLDVRVTRILEDGDGPPRNLAYFADITSEVETRHALLRMQESLSLALQAGRMGWWTRDLVSGEVTWSQELEEIFGIPRGSFRGTRERFLDFVHPDDRDLVTAAVTRSVETGEDYAVKFRFQRPDGGSGWMEGRGRVIRDATGRPTSAFGIGIDVSEHVQVEEHLRRVERRKQFRIEFSDALREHTQPREMVLAACQMVADELKVDRCGYSLVDVPRETLTILGSVSRGIAPLSGIIPFSALDPEMVRRHFAREPVACDDAMLDPITASRYESFYGRNGIRAFIGIPIIRDDRWVANFSVHSLSPRAWSPDEIRLMQDLAERLADALDRTQALLDLQEREALYRQQSDALPQLIWTTDPQGNPLYANRRWQDYFGMDLVEASESQFTRIIHPDDYGYTMREWQRCLATGEMMRIEHRARHHSGEYRWHLLIALPARNSEGRIFRWFGSMTDIEETKRLEQEVVEVAERLRFALAAASAGIWHYNPKTREGHWDEQCYRMYGFDPATVAADPQIWLARIADEDRISCLEAVAAARESSGEFRLEYRYRHPEWGERRLVSAGGVVRSDGFLAGITYDITEAHARVTALETTLRVGRALASELEPDRIVQLLADTATQATGAEFGAFFYRRSVHDPTFTLFTLVGAPRGAFPQAPEVRDTPIFDATFVHRQSVLLDDVTADPRFGTGPVPMPSHHLPVRSYLAVPVNARSGEVIGAVLLGHTKPGRFSDQHLQLVETFASQTAVAYENAMLYEKLQAANEELEQKVRERTAELEASNEALQGFTYHVSHDLRAPIRAIVSTSRMLQEDYGSVLPDEGHRLLVRQADAGNKLGQLIDDLLKLSRLSREELTFGPVDLTQLGHEAAEEARIHHPESTTVIEIAPDLHTRGDARLLKLAVLNLIENAVKYSPRGGHVRLGQREDGVFFVSDEGIGMDPRYLEKIFEPFERLHRDDEFRGTGIGLTNVRQVFVRHGGRIWAESRLGEGSTFYFTI